MIDLFTKGINHFYDTEEEVIYYYTDSMREKNCVIRLEDTYMNDDLQHYLAVDLLVTGDAYQFGMYWDAPLAPLVMRRMIKDIVVFIKYNRVDTIIEFLKEMSVEYMSSSSQSMESHQVGIARDVIGNLTKVEMYEKRNA